MATIVVAVTGGVAAFKAPIVVRECQRAGHDVYVAATRASLEFVGRSTWEGITSRPVAVDIAGEGRAEHVELARIADLIIVVPATANSLAHLAAGFANDMVSLTVLASNAPVVVAPAMHSNMWLAPATQANVRTLRERGVHIIDPTSGALGSGDNGIGRLPDPEEIARKALEVLSHHERVSHVLADRTVVVTAGGTREPIDPVRFLGNQSSGRQGLAIASAAARAGAAVRVIAANIESALLAGLPSTVQVTRVGSALQMREATVSQVIDADALVMAAAVADFRPEAVSQSKMKKDPTNEEAPTIRLVRNPDILAEIGHSEKRPPLVVGFAAETGTEEEILAYGADKAVRKGADFICLNRVGSGIGFGDVANDVRVLDASGHIVGRYVGSKGEVAAGLVGHMASFLDNLKW
ncbi:bifunctional phosphopantothenoylcysteine decarboxylase/phosphopantothenate--cysteine ligase CoaBC [Pauljensenia sp. 27098_8_83]